MRLTDLKLLAVHPSVRGFPGLAARHFGFVAALGLGGLIAAAGVGVTVWLVGWPRPFEAFLFAWLLSPLAIAVLVRITGALRAMQYVWLLNLVLLISVIAVFTGGLASFVLPWFLVIPTEAALTGERRMVLAAAGLGLAGVGAVLGLELMGWLPASRIPLDMLPPFLTLGIMSAIAYASAVAISIQHAHRLSEDAARDGEARYRFLAEHVTDVITRHATDGRIVFASPASRSLLGFSPRELEGQTFLPHVHPEDRDGVRQAFERAQFFGGDASVEYRVKHRSEGYRWVETRCRPVLLFEAMRLSPTPRGLPAPHCFEIICVTRDVSQRKDYESELVEARNAAEAANEAKSRFLANMSHELRTPLNAVIGFSEMIQAQTFGPVGSAKYREYAQLIHASGTHLLNLINDVLDMSKVEAGKFVIEPEAMAVDAVVRESLKMVAVTAEKAGIQFKTAYGDDLPPLYADRRAVRQILLNLLSNAIKFSHEGSTVLIEAVEDGDMILIAVRDYGVGIAEADLARIGRPYEQAKAQTGDGFVKGKGGTGLGLALVRALAGLHGGTMTVQSELGVGTRVIVSLPRHADGMRLPQREPDSEAPDSEAAPEILKGAA